MTNKAQREAKRQRRETQREEREREKRRLGARRRRRDLTIYGGVAVLVVAIIGLLGWSAFGPKPGEQVPSLGQEHIAPGAPHPEYNSNPPTSGWHYGQTAPPGVHRTEIADEILIHNLEHGCIWISYKDPKDTDLVEKLEALAERYPRILLLTPRPKNDSAIAVAAWQRLMKLEKYEEGKIVAFINAWRNKGPERLNCSGGAMPPR